MQTDTKMQFHAPRINKHTYLVSIRRLAELMRHATFPWFLSGGVSLDVRFCTWSRDHEDLDIEIFAHDKALFFEYVISSGMACFDIYGGEIGTVAELENIPKWYFFVCDRNDINFGFEVLLLRTSADGEVLCEMGDIHFSREIYQNPFRALIDGEYSIPLAPAITTLVHKRIEYRTKDIKDINTHFANLSQDEQNTITKLLSSIGLTLD